MLGARLVVALWTKASVASPNVRHEAIIAREAEKMLPVMVDELAPTDFPMGLFMVQALMIGRSERQFNAVKPRFLDEVRARIGGPARRGTAAAPKKRRRAPPALARLGLGALLVAPRCSSPGRGSCSREPGRAAGVARAAASLDRPESLARERVARGAEGMISGEGALIGSNWAWGAGQLIAAAPAESREIAGALFRLSGAGSEPDMRLLLLGQHPASIGNAWVIIASARLRHPAPDGLLETILDAQHPEGWWTISFNAVRSTRMPPSIPPRS